MKYNEAEEIAESIWNGDEERVAIAQLVKFWIGRPTDPAHPFVDMAEDALVRRFEYEHESQLHKDKADVFNALKTIVSNAIIDAE